MATYRIVLEGATFSGFDCMVGFEHSVAEDRANVTKKINKAEATVTQGDEA